MTQSLSRRSLWLGLLAGIALVPGLAAAQSAFPNKPIRLIVPFAGGVTDQLTRVYGEKLSVQLGQPVLIETKAGASGGIGARYVAQAPADGYTLLIGSDGLALNSVLTPETDFHPVKDLEPITPLLGVPFLLVTGNQQPYATLQDLVAAAKSRPGSLNYASNGTSSSAYLMGEALKSEAGITAEQIPYKGGGEQALALMSGEVNFAFLTTAFVAPYIRDGAIRPLANASVNRSGLYPEVKTVNELGFKSLGRGATWFGVFSPKNTPPDVRKRLVEASKTVLADPHWQSTGKGWGGDLPDGKVPDAELATQLQDSIDYYTKTLKALGLKKS